MIVTCEQCSRRFHLDDNRISASGSKVRCSKCKHVFKVYPQIDRIVAEPVEPLVATPPTLLEPAVADIFEFDAVRLDEFPLPPAQEPHVPPLDDSAGIVVPPSEPSTLEPSFLSIDTGIPEPHPSTPSESDLKPISFEDIDLSLQSLQKEVTTPTDSDSSAQKALDEIDVDLEFLTLEKDEGKDKSPDAAVPSLNLDAMTLDDLDSLVSAPPPQEEARQPDDIETAEPSTFVEEIYVEDVPTSGAVVEQMPSSSLGQDQAVFKKAASDHISFDDIEALDLDEIEKLIEKNQMGLVSGERSIETAASLEPLTKSGRPVDPKSLKDPSTGVSDAGLSHQQDAFTETAILDPRTLSVGPHLSQEDKTEDYGRADTHPKKSVSKTLIALLCLVVLVGGGYLAMTFFPNIHIPFLSSQPQEPEDLAGNRKIRIYDVNSKFMDTAGAGRLFVITGKIRNDYAEVRGLVSVKGKLYDVAKKEVQSQTVFCGNVLSDEDLHAMQVDAIQKALSHRLGKDRVNARIEPGGSVPFMMVFSQLPDQLDEFSLEVIGSAKIS
uniref:DUF3426 domain-containing protein n=1 Tax=Desulfatirhabdium butyrativorans TaxID=340467 RepID=A0A7C4VSH6_9BACT